MVVTMNYLSPPTSEARAEFYWKRLGETISPQQDWVGLDFGCGQGHLLRLMASRLRLVFGIDISPEMVAASESVTDGIKNVKVKMMATVPAEAHYPPFDLVSANSVVHYIEPEHLNGWLRWLIRSLSHRGALIIANVPRRRDNRLKNLCDSLRWGLRNNCFFSVIHESLLMARHGALFGHNRFDPGELLALVESCGGEGRILPRNLDVPAGRFSVIVRRRPR